MRVIPRRLRASCPALAVAAAIVLLSAPGAGQEAPAAAARRVVSDIVAPAIDRGVRMQDAPRPPRGGALELTRRFQEDSEAWDPGRVIVKFRPGAGPIDRLLAAESVGGGLLARPSAANFDVLAIGPDRHPEAVARALAARPEVEYAQASYYVEPSFVPNDPLYPLQWNFPLLDMERAWQINPGATPEIVVAVLDTGLAYRDLLVQFHAVAWRLGDGPVFPSLGTVVVPFAAAPDLAAADRFASPFDFIWEDDLPVDVDGHGTHVAGTIGQLTGNGVGGAGMAFNVRLMPLKVIPGLWDLIFGAPGRGTDEVVARAVRYAADNGAHVINLSIGRTVGGPAPVVEDAVRYAVSRGAFVAIAAGNDFETGNRPNRLAEFAPLIDGAVAVGAIDRNRRRAHYSTAGSFVELAAPGGSSRAGGTPGMILQQTYDLDLVETYVHGPYGAPRFDVFVGDFYQGTSMAAPHVAGFAALLYQQGIRNPAAIEAAMKRFATDLGTSGRNDEFGEGLIDPRTTLRGLGLAR